MTCFTLNEWDHKEAGTSDWRQKIDAQRGAVLATELKNNACKLAKWTTQTLLAGAEEMKLGFVARRNRKDRTSHQVGLSEECEECEECEERSDECGGYLIILIKIQFQV